METRSQVGVRMTPGVYGMRRRENSTTPLTGHTDWVFSVAFSPDGNTIATGGFRDRTVRLWEADTGELRHTLRHGGNVINVVFSSGWKHDRKWRVGDATVRLWEADTGELRHTLTGHTYGGRSVAFSPDGNTIAGWGGDTTVRLWDADTGELRHTLEHTGTITNVVFSPDGNTVVSASLAMHLWDAETGEHLQTLTGHTDWVFSVAFSPDSTTIASGGGYSDWTVRLWKADTGEHLQTLTGHTEGVNSVAFSPDGNTIASGSRDRTVRLWDAETGELRHTLTGHTYGVRSIAFSPDGNTIASGSYHTVRLWDAETGELRHTLTGHTGSVESVAFSPDGTTLASSGDYRDWTVRLWDAETGEHRHTLIGHTYGVEGVAFSPDGTTLANGSSDGTILLWDVRPPAPERLAEDVNADGTVNIQDLVAVAAALGQTGENAADVNGDGEVNIQDLVAVAAALGEGAAAPSALRQQATAELTPADVQHWITQAQHANLTDPHSQAGIRFLQYLLAALIPKETALFANYPNPFNPETWIPYQLANPADVSIAIYGVDGALVRTLDLGYQPIGIYHGKSRAAYWDGKNAVGEPVASGVYFFTLKAGDFAATRKMLIRK